MPNPAPIAVVCAVAVAVSACGTVPAPKPSDKPEPEPAPEWVRHIEVGGDLCGIGVAGAGYPGSPYPKEMAAERAARNLAGVLGTRVRDVMIERMNRRGTSVQYARDVHVDKDLVSRVAKLAATEFWLDVRGQGPFARAGFTYAHSCITAEQAAGLFHLPAAELAPALKPQQVTPEQRPAWLQRRGEQPGGRLCAVGFSLPMFHADQTFQAVVKDIRAQLAKVLTTFVASSYEELSTDQSQMIEAMTLATNRAVSRGAIVTHYWYDKDGIGPHERARTTYGWGCVYPMDVLQTSLAKLEQKASADQRNTIKKVRERAENAFAALEEEASEANPASP